MSDESMEPGADEPVEQDPERVAGSDPDDAVPEDESADDLDGDDPVSLVTGSGNDADAEPDDADDDDDDDDDDDEPDDDDDDDDADSNDDDADDDSDDDDDAAADSDAVAAGAADAPTLRIAAVDLQEIAHALDSRGDTEDMWLDPVTGQIERTMLDGDDDLADELHDRGYVRVDNWGSRDAYHDMEVFAEAVADRRVAEALDRALEGKGAFGRFRSALDRHPDVQDQWLTFRRAREDARAIRWLLDRELVSAADADAEWARRDTVFDEVMAAIGAPAGMQIEWSDIGPRWPDVVKEIEAGRPVYLDRDGRAWATIQPD